MPENGKRRGFPCRLPRYRLLCAWGMASVIAWLAWCVLPPACAGPPYAVDDPGTLDYSRLFLYVAEIGSLSQGIYTHSAPNLVLGYGIKPNLEAAFGLSGYTSNTPAIALDRFNNPSFAIKWRFWEERRNAPALALAYQATYITEDQGFAIGYSVHNTYLTGSKSIGKGLLWGNTGVNILPRPNLSVSVFHGVAYDYPLGRRWRVGAQLYGNSALNASGIPKELAWGIGATYVASDRTTLLLQLGRSMMGVNDLNVYVGALIQLN